MTTATADLETTADQPESDADTGHSGPSYDDINTPVIVMVGVISTIVTVCTIFFVQGLCYQWQNSYIRERSFDYVNEPVRQIVEDQKSLLDGDAEKGIKPVSTSMSDVIATYGSKQNH